MPHERRKPRHLALTDSDWEKLGLICEYINRDIDPKSFKPTTITDLVESYVGIGIANTGKPPPTAKEVVDVEERKQAGDEYWATARRGKGKVHEVGGIPISQRDTLGSVLR